MEQQDSHKVRYLLTRRSLILQELAHTPNPYLSNELSLLMLSFLLYICCMGNYTGDMIISSKVSCMHVQCRLFTGELVGIRCLKS